MKKTILFIFLSLTGVIFNTVGAARHFTMTFTQLEQRCLAYPEHTKNVPKSFISCKNLLHTARRSAAINNIGLQAVTKWLDGASPFAGKMPEFAPFVQKLTIGPKSTVLFFGDLHGNIHSLMRTLNYLCSQNILDSDFRIIQPDTYLVFLGDYVDRGSYGIEVIYTLMRLRMANHRHVFLVRGNHEDTNLNTHYGFADELFERVGAQESDLRILQQWYTTMPLALFIGVDNGTTADYIQCCHGGPELGFNASGLLKTSDTIQFQPITQLARADNVRNLPVTLKHDVLHYVPTFEIENITPTAPTSPVTIGLMWADVIANPANYPSKIVGYNKGRGWVHGKDLTKYWLHQQSGPRHTVHAIIRGHQHYGDMLKQLIANKGCVNLWNNTVYTILSAPVAGKNFPYDAFTMLKTADKYKDWSIEPVVVT